MSATLRIELTPKATSIIAGMQTLPAKMVQAIARGIDEGNQLAIQNIVQNHLTGLGPFPPEQHKLGVVTNRLRGSVRATAATIADQKVDSSIGTNVFYAFTHEFGAVIHHKARKTSVRLRTDRSGNLLRQLRHSNLAIFAHSSHKQAKEVEANVGAHDVEMPERAPFRTGIRESVPQYTRAISSNLVALWKELGN